MLTAGFVIKMLVLFLLAIIYGAVNKEKIVGNYILAKKKMDQAEKAREDYAQDVMKRLETEDFDSPIARARLETEIETKTAQLDKEYDEAKKAHDEANGSNIVGGCASIFVPVILFCATIYYPLSMFFNGVGIQVVNLVTPALTIIFAAYTMMRNKRIYGEMKEFEANGGTWIPTRRSFFERSILFTPNWFFVYAIVVVISIGLAPK